MSRKYRDKLEKKRAKTTRKYIREFQNFIRSNFDCNFTCKCFIHYEEKSIDGYARYGEGGLLVNKRTSQSYPVVRIYLKEILDRGYNDRFNEYDHYDNDSEIGGFYYINSLTLIRVVLAHEFAHAYEAYLRIRTDKQFGTRHLFSNLSSNSNAHGKKFQEIYRVLRVNLVNKHIPDQKKCRNNYLYQIKNAILTEYGF